MTQVERLTPIVKLDLQCQSQLSKSCAPFTDPISAINNMQVDRLKHIDAVMPIYKLIECHDSYSKPSGSSYAFCREETPLSNAAITGSVSIKFKSKVLGSTNNAGIIYAEVALPSKYLSSFWKLLKCL